MKLKRRGADIRTPLNIFVRESGLPRYSVSIHPAILPKAIPRDSYDKTSESSNEHELNRIKRNTEEHLVDAQKLLPGNRDAEDPRRIMINNLLLILCRHYQPHDIIEEVLDLFYFKARPLDVSLSFPQQRSSEERSYEGLHEVEGDVEKL